MKFTIGRLQILVPVLLVGVVNVVVNGQDDGSPVGSPIFDEIFKTYPTISTKTSTTNAPSSSPPAITPETTPTPTIVSITTNIPTPAVNDTTTPPAPSFFAITSSPVVTTNTPTSTVTNETLAPSVMNGTMVPTIFSNVTKNLDCTFPSEIDIKGDQTLLLRHVINPVNRTVTVQLEYVGTAWISIGFSTTIFMIPNIAVIGLPDEQTVLKYNMISKLVDGVTPLSDDQQTLTDTSIIQKNGITTLTFTQPLDDIPNVPIIAGQNTYIWAHGFSNPLATHDSVSRGGTTTFINECLEIGETSSPTVLPTIAPTISPITRTPIAAKAPTEPVITDGLDCSFQNDIDVRGDGIITLRQVINPNNQTVTVQLEYFGNAWVSFGFSNTTKMVPNIAVIGLPDEQTVLKYDMISQTDAGVYPLPDDQQTLTDTSIVQKDGITTLTFTQPLDDLDGLPVIPGENNMYLWSYGISNPLASHDLMGRGHATAKFTECLKVGETAAPIAEATKSPTKAPVAAPGPSGGIIDLGNGRKQRSLFIPASGVDLTFITDEPNELLTIEMIYPGVGYISVAFSADPLMPDSLAVMALPGDGKNVPEKWDMGAAKTVAGVTLAPTERQTLIDASYTQNDTYTTMKFTKKLVEPNEQAIYLSGMNYILWAVGSTNEFQAHPPTADGRGHIAIDFSSSESGVVGSGGSPNKNWWLVHGISLCIAWIILVPVAVSVSVLKAYFSAMPPGFWFRTHRNLNTIGVLLTIFGFAISVKLYADENGGSNAKHFKASQHHKVGLVIFLFAFLQAMSGFFRPHLPHKPDPVIDEKDDDDDNVDEEQHDGDKVEGPAHVDHHPLTKSPQRILFEYQHRILGVITMVLGWINCDSGFDAFNKRFFGPDLTAAIWSVIGTILLITIILTIYDRSLRPN